MLHSLNTLKFALQQNIFSAYEIQHMKMKKMAPFLANNLCTRPSLPSPFQSLKKKKWYSHPQPPSPPIVPFLFHKPSDNHSQT